MVPHQKTGRDAAGSSRPWHHGSGETGDCRRSALERISGRDPGCHCGSAAGGKRAGSADSRRGAADFCVSPGRAFLSYCRLADVCPQLGGGKACRGNLPGLSYDFRSRTGSDFLRDSSGMLCEPSCAGGGPGNLRKSYKKFTNRILTRCGRAKDRVSDMLLNTGKNPGNACIYRKNCV